MAMKSAKISGTDRELPIGKILCIGRNYAEHIRELGNDSPSTPVIFMKPASSVIDDGGTIDVLVSPEYNEWKGSTTLQLRLRDFRRSS